MTPEIWSFIAAFGAEQQLAIVAAVLFGVGDADLVEALLDGAGGFVGGQNALARAPPSCWRSRSVRRDSCSSSCFDFQRFDARQFLAFKPFQKRPAGGRDIGEILLHAGMGRAPPPYRRRPPPTAAGPPWSPAATSLRRRHGARVERRRFRRRRTGRSTPGSRCCAGGSRTPSMVVGPDIQHHLVGGDRRATGTVRWAASALNSLATTTSVGSRMRAAAFGRHVRSRLRAVSR